MQWGSPQASWGAAIEKSAGCSATLKDGVFYVFSTNAAPFEDRRAYSPFAVYSLLEHGGDFAAAAGALRARGFGSAVPEPDVDLTALRVTAGERDVAAEPVVPGPIDPGPVPASLLRVPGFIDEVIDYSLSNAPYPEPVLAFCGAVALQATLAGRKVRDPQDNRPAVYLLGLANTDVHGNATVIRGAVPGLSGWSSGASSRAR